MCKFSLYQIVSGQVSNGYGCRHCFTNEHGVIWLWGSGSVERCSLSVVGFVLGAADEWWDWCEAGIIDLELLAIKPDALPHM